jgi:putative hydrolase
VLHELTHAWQFEAHPWLREHIGDLMSAMLMSELAGDPAAPRLPSAPAMIRSLPTLVRRQLGAVGSIQAVMSVCEGYSNFVMHQVGSRHLADFDRLEQAFHERAQQRSLVERLVLVVTGMNMKLRQYEVGERFAEAVTAQGGLALLNRVWEGPEQMPSLAELREPQRWVDRIRSIPILAG